MDFDWGSIEAGFTADELADLRTHEKRHEEVHQADMKLQAEISDAESPEIDQALVEWQMPKAVRWPINDRRALLFLVMSLERNLAVAAAYEAVVIAPLRRLEALFSAGIDDTPFVEARHLRAGRPETPTAAAESACIMSLGDGRYSIGAHPPQLLTDRQDRVLLAFLEESPLSNKALDKAAGVTDGRKVLRTLRAEYGRMFAPAIRVAEAKGKGGNHVAIRNATIRPLSDHHGASDPR
jgi:hypothetical protein